MQCVTIAINCNALGACITINSTCAIAELHVIHELDCDVLFAFCFESGFQLAFCADLDGGDGLDGVPVVILHGLVAGSDEVGAFTLSQIIGWVKLVVLSTSYLDRRRAIATVCIIQVECIAIIIIVA